MLFLSCTFSADAHYWLAGPVQEQIKILLPHKGWIYWSNYGKPADSKKEIEP